MAKVWYLVAGLSLAFLVVTEGASGQYQQAKLNAMCNNRAIWPLFISLSECMMAASPELKQIMDVCIPILEMKEYSFQQVLEYICESRENLKSMAECVAKNYEESKLNREQLQLLALKCVGTN